MLQGVEAGPQLGDLVLFNGAQAREEGLDGSPDGPHEQQRGRRAEHGRQQAEGQQQQAHLVARGRELVAAVSCPRLAWAEKAVAASSIRV